LHERHRSASTFATALSDFQDDDLLYPVQSIESSQEYSPAESGHQHGTDSSGESPDMVWDELDELKARIKRLEGGDTTKPSAASAAASGDSSERPRTATTNPTTIDSSPNQPRKQDEKVKEVDNTTTPAAVIANIHPLLHSALTRAKDQLAPNVVRALEATAADALQLATMSTGYTSPSIVNGITVNAVNDRQVRRRADNMCRNLTDLCIALCDTRADPPTIVSSPITMEPPLSPPSRQFSRLHPPSFSQTRPMSRLEQRKASLLGGLGFHDSPLSPRGSFCEQSEVESTPSHLQPPARISANPSRTLRSRVPQSSEEPSPEEDRFPRAPSRAMTDFGTSQRSNMKSRFLTINHHSDERSPRSPGSRLTSSFRDIRRNKTTYGAPPTVPEEDSTSTASEYQRPPKRFFSSNYETSGRKNEQQQTGGRRSSLTNHVNPSHR
jgi:hypothetical protein